MMTAQAKDTSCASWHAFDGFVASLPASLIIGAAPYGDISLHHPAADLVDEVQLELEDVRRQVTGLVASTRASRWRGDPIRRDK